MNETLERRQSAALLDARLLEIERRLDKGSSRMDQISDELNENTEVTREVRQLLAAAKGGLSVLGWIGAAARWVAAIAGMCTAVYALWHAIKTGGDLPKWPK